MDCDRIEAACWSFNLSTRHEGTETAYNVPPRVRRDASTYRPDMRVLKQGFRRQQVETTAASTYRPDMRVLKPSPCAAPARPLPLQPIDPT